MLELLRRLAIRPGLTTELIGASLFANMLALATPLFVIQVLNRYVAHGVDATLMTLSTGALIAIALEFGFRQIRHRLARGVSAGQDDKLSVSGFGLLTTAKSGALDRLPPGQQREFMSGLDTIRAAYGATNVGAVLDLPFAFLFLGVLAILSPTLALIAATFTGVAFFAGLAVMLSIRGNNKRLIDETRKSNLLVGSAVGEKDTLRAFNGSAFLLRAWHAQARVIHEISRRIIGRQGLMSSFSTTIVALMSVAIMTAGAVMVVAGHMDVGVLIGANILSARALQPVTKFVQVGESFQKAKQAAQQLREFMKLPRESDTGSAKRDYQGALEFRDLGFVHEGAAGPLFESMSLSIPAGAVCVVSGANGTGKSTLARLIIGLIDPSRGQILADGLDLRQVHPAWWRRQVVYLPQEPGFLNATIGENLSLLDPDIDDAGLNRVIDAAGLRPFLDETPAGFDTPIVSNGRNLALGVRRRLALARALTADGKLVVLDEPIEGLDAKGRETIANVLGELHRAGRTIIALSHDPDIINNAQMVIDLNQKPEPSIVTVPRPVESGGDGNWNSGAPG
ncbi:MAG: ATP-binding cassette domain-containing protein [Rhodospirillales bacterium]|jgi:ATP-binding cassette subfamily C protein LapB|nr:ABC transporter [Rhodospirillaceae bacterium]MDP6429125.1 ATP-binding cassette domain-containing protein [Rhodospirillales bacterium]MDP6645691.1 ATP-binding cassette domain-containing protein [Rhodospirillales bacterium]|tara:strand:- start:1487 stop:3187 length:1701 start_codon:yes stop_codon:yes gene_type:complete